MQLIKVTWMGFLSSHEWLKQFCIDIYNTGNWTIEHSDKRGWIIRKTSREKRNDARQLPKVLTSQKMVAIMCFVGPIEDINWLHNHMMKIGWRFSLVRNNQYGKNVYELWRERP